MNEERKPATLEERVHEMEVYSAFNLMVIKDQVEHIEIRLNKAVEKLTRLENRLLRVEGFLARVRTAVGGDWT